MAIVPAKCKICGGSIKVSNISRTGVCPFCGTEYVTEDVIINNVVNNTYNEHINGQKIDRHMVLEQILKNYYGGGYAEESNVKQYAYKVMEIDKNDTLANFVAFSNFKDASAIVKFLNTTKEPFGLDLVKEMLRYVENTRTKGVYELISFDKFKNFVRNSSEDNKQKILVWLCLNDCSDGQFQDAILQELENNDYKTNPLELVKTYAEPFKHLVTNLRFLINVIYVLHAEPEEDNEALQFLSTYPKVSKLRFLRELDYFSKNHADFYYDKASFEAEMQRIAGIIDRQAELKKQLDEKAKQIQEERQQRFEQQQQQQKKFNKKWLYAIIPAGIIAVAGLIWLLVAFV